MDKDMPTSQAVAMTPEPWGVIPASAIFSYMKAVKATGYRMDYHQAAWEISAAMIRKENDEA